MSEQHKSRKYNDPILDNSYKKGEIDFQYFDNKIEIDSNFKNETLSDYYNSYEYHRSKLLAEMIDSIFKKTKWDLSYPIKKKIPKIELSELFQYIRNKITDTTYSESEIFIEIADYLNVKYDVLYVMIPVIYKRELLQELDEVYKIKSKLKIFKLF